MQILKFSLRTVLGSTTLLAITTQLSIQVGMGASIVNFCSYFTNLSNLLAAGVLLFTSDPRVAAGRIIDRVRALSTLNMAVVGIVFALLLRNEDLGALRPWVNFVLHDLMPCAVVLDWVLDPPATRLGIPDLFRCLIFPAVYLAYTLLRGAQTGWYPYPFLNPMRLGGGYATVAEYSAGITVIFLLIGWALLTIGNRIGGSRR